MHPLVKVGVLVEALPRGFAYVVPIIESCVYLYVCIHTYIYIYTYIYIHPPMFLVVCTRANI